MSPAPWIWSPIRKDHYRTHHAVDGSSTTEWAQEKRSKFRLAREHSALSEHDMLESLPPLDGPGHFDSSIHNSPLTHSPVHLPPKPRSLVNYPLDKLRIAPFPRGFDPLPRLGDVVESNDPFQRQNRRATSPQWDKSHGFVYEFGTGPSVGSEGKRPKRRSGLNDKSRAKASRVRSIGACWRCRLLKSSVSTHPRRRGKSQECYYSDLT